MSIVKSGAYARKGSLSRIIFTETGSYCLCFSFYPNNSGQAFSANRGLKPVSIELYYQADNSDNREYFINERIGEFNRQSEAFKAARDYIRKNNLKSKLKELASE